MKDRSRVTYALWVLFAINTLNFFDRNIAGVVTEPIRKEFNLSDTGIAFLSTVFTLMYAALGVPLGRLTDKANRIRILAGGVFVWSLFTAAAGLARNYFQMLVARLGVGVGECTCAPASTSLIGDLFPASKRAKALAIFMMGLPVGIVLSNVVSGPITQRFGWRDAYYVAGIPGIICVLAILLMHEPKRGGTEVHDVGSRKREGSPFMLVLSIPTMWWLIASGALHNFNMYALGQFLVPLLIRFHGMNISGASRLSAIVYGASGIPGLLIGGIVGDAIMKRRINGRLLVGAIGIVASVPFMFLGLSSGKGELVRFSVFIGLGIGVMYAYYSTVYSTIQDVIEPSLRGTAMALYFFAMYVLGASFGPVGTGFASDYFTSRAAVAAGVTSRTQQALEPFKAEGLHYAMYIVPILGVLLALVLVAASRTVTKDVERLREWMRECAAEQPVV